MDSTDVPHGEDDSIEREVLQDCAEVELLGVRSEDEFRHCFHRADALILWHHLQVTAEMLSGLTKTRLIVRNGVGYDNVDIEAAAAAGIAVANVPDYGTEEVADHAIALILALFRQLKPVLADVASGGCDWRSGLAARRIAGHVLGIIGCGGIGTATSLRAQALGFDVRFFDPFLPAGYEKAIGVQREGSLGELLASADVVSIHVPLTEQTCHLIGGPELKQMKRSAYLVNTARGAVVSYDALRDALLERVIAGAGLDVLEDEPFGGELLQRLPNCLVTPHSAFYSQESLIEMRRKSAQIVKAALLHGQYNNIVNRENLRVWNGDENDPPS